MHEKLIQARRLIQHVKDTLTLAPVQSEREVHRNLVVAIGKLETALVLTDRLPEAAPGLTAAHLAAEPRGSAAHAYLVDDECEQINWGGDVKYPDDPGLVLLYARPVEEPGEVERLTRERDEARRNYAELDKTAEAALAETRERLEKVEAAAKGFFEAFDAEPEKDCWDTETGEEEEGGARFASDWSWADYHEDVEKARNILRGTLSPQASSAALAGDGKERGGDPLMFTADAKDPTP